MTTAIEIEPSAPPVMTPDDRAGIESRFKKNEKLLAEVADKGASTPQESANIFRAMLQWLMRVLGRVSNMLRGQSGPNQYTQAHEELEQAKTPAQMAEIAKKVSFSAKDDSKFAEKMSDEVMQSRVGALLQARAGVEGVEAAVYSSLASSQFKPSPDQADIIAAALQAQSLAIEELTSEGEQLLEQIRRALQIRGGVTMDVSKLDLKQLADIAKEVNLPDVLKLCDHAKREKVEVDLLKKTAKTMYQHAWESMMPMSQVQGASNRIWSANEQERMLGDLAKEHPEVAKQRELLERSQIAANHSGDAAQPGQAGNSMSLMASGDTDALRRKAAEDAAKVAAARKAAQESLAETDDQASKRAANQAASARELQRIQALEASGQGRVLGQDGKPLSEADKAVAQKAAQDAIAKAQGISNAAAVAAPVVSVVNPAAGAAISTVGTVAGATGAALNIAEMRARVHANLRPDEIGMEMPEDPYAESAKTIRELAQKAGQVDGQGPAPTETNGGSDDGAGDLPDAPKPVI